MDTKKHFIALYSIIALLTVICVGGYIGHEQRIQKLEATVVSMPSMETLRNMQPTLQMMSEMMKDPNHVKNMESMMDMMKMMNEDTMMDMDTMMGSSMEKQSAMPFSTGSSQEEHDAHHPNQ